MHSFIEYLMYLPKEKQVFISYLNTKLKTRRLSTFMSGAGCYDKLSVL